MGGRKYQLTIDMAVLMIHKVYKTWEDKKNAGTLMIDVKETFNYVS